MIYLLIKEGRERRKEDEAIEQDDEGRKHPTYLFLLAVNHFVVFLLGTEPLDTAYGAAVYVCWDAAVNLAGALIFFMSYTQRCYKIRIPESSR